MNIRAKKRTPAGIQRMETFGEIKEILINQDFMDPQKVSVSLCFRGNNSSGIVDLTPEEIGVMNKEVASRKKLLKGIKVIKFSK